MTALTRRAVIATLTAGPLAACVPAGRSGSGPAAGAAPAEPSFFAPDIYAAISTEPFPVPAVPLGEIDPAFRRRVVDAPAGRAPGTIVVDAKARYLYLVQPGGRAIRYGVGVGREGFGWAGNATVHDKQAWPDWYPPKEMLQRQPELKKQMTELRSGIGMKGGPGNPLGARALYLWEGNRDTLYRIHGTLEPATIGKNVSSGCIRMVNQDVMDLYERVPAGTTVVVLPA
jgi:lipoprotein-anchoring transpeptidase ErfK/SrfK